ncbi:hypothetical protein QBC47DRAFT_406054 [Echria macrotheca]|uniref:Uncharacterized protein n=1 Tax=Echria macrotheca TaxID=438768 RepID=A0AAJ0B5V7_9PEZI|nr:hypothetical protein QBC47DRAFT_406054 [Echria macrotheca]
MLPKIFITALLAVPYVAALAVPPEVDATNIVVRNEGDIVPETIAVRAEAEAIQPGADIDAADRKKHRGKGKKGKGRKERLGGKRKGKGKGKHHKGKRAVADADEE